MKILGEIFLSCNKVGSGKTRHIRCGVDVTSIISRVVLATLNGDTGVYIFYYDSEGNEINDLYYENYERAKRHVEWEFDIKLDSFGTDLNSPGVDQA